jgi:hypothetical protein
MCHYETMSQRSFANTNQGPGSLFVDFLIISIMVFNVGT